jgi:hypothetical protein
VPSIFQGILPGFFGRGFNNSSTLGKRNKLGKIYVESLSNPMARKE